MSKLALVMSFLTSEAPSSDVEWLFMMAHLPLIVAGCKKIYLRNEIRALHHTNIVAHQRKAFLSPCLL